MYKGKIKATATAKVQRKGGDASEHTNVTGCRPFFEGGLVFIFTRIKQVHHTYIFYTYHLWNCVAACSKPNHTYAGHIRNASSHITPPSLPCVGSVAAGASRLNKHDNHHIYAVASTRSNCNNMWIAAQIQHTCQLMPGQRCDAYTHMPMHAVECWCDHNNEKMSSHATTC